MLDLFARKKNAIGRNCSITLAHKEKETKKNS